MGLLQVPDTWSIQTWLRKNHSSAAENGVLIVVDCFKATDVASSMVALKRAHCMKHWQTKLET
jgi:hypothetical protein